MSLQNKLSSQTGSRALLVSLVLVLGLIAAACGGSSDPESSDSVNADGDADTDTDGTADSSDGDTDDQAATTSDDGSADDDGEQGDDQPVAPPLTGDVDPSLAGNLMGQILGAEPAQLNVDCLLSASNTDEPLKQVLLGVGTPNFEFTPERYAALAGGVRTCVGDEEILASLRPLAGEDAEVPADALECFSPQVSQDADSGPETFAALSSIAVGLQPTADGVPLAVGILAECIPAEVIVEQLSGQAEAQVNFEIDVDRSCVASQFDTAQAEAFWESIVVRDPEVAGSLGDITSDCGTPYDNGLAKEVPSSFVPWSGDRTLAGVSPELRDKVYTAGPPTVVTEGASYSAVLTTELGDISVRLYNDVAPVTVNNFVALARDGYFDNTFFHRVLEGFMAQAGDPLNDGFGGPGYAFEDEVDNDLQMDRRGLLAMANSGANSNGSQFFITFDAADWLTGKHTIFGEVVAGDDVLAQIRLREPTAPTSRGTMLISVQITEG